MLAVSACGGPAPRAADPSPTAAAALAGRDSVVVAWCDRFAARSTTSPDTKVHVVTLAAYSAADGTGIAERSAALPDGAVVEPLCGTSTTMAASADRQLFDTGFGLIAGTVPGPGGKGTVATAFTLPGGKPVAGGPVEGRSPAFQAGTSVLWYETDGRQVLSRDLLRPGDAPQARGTAPGPDFALADGRAWTTRPMESKPDQVVAAPGGAVAAGTGFWRRDAPTASYGPEYVDPVMIGPSRNGNPVLPGSEQVPTCAPRLWTDAQTLLCNARDNLLLVGFAADFGRVDTVTPLLPREERYVESAVLSPDGRSLAYLSTVFPATGSDQREAELYRVDLAPGARPVLLGVIPTSDADRQDAGDPHLVAWQ
jgi:hypothetical protein